MPNPWGGGVGDEIAANTTAKSCCSPFMTSLGGHLLVEKYRGGPPLQGLSHAGQFLITAHNPSSKASLGAAEQDMLAAQHQAHICWGHQ